MKAMKRNMSILGSLLLAAATLAVVSCTPGAILPGPEPPVSGEVNIRFSMSMARSGPAVTRAADDAEFVVNNMAVVAGVRAGGRYGKFHLPVHSRGP